MQKYTTLRAQILRVEIFAQSIFAILAPNHKIKFRESYLNWPITKICSAKFIFRWGTHLYMLLFPSVSPSVAHHISGTVTFGTHV